MKSIKVICGLHRSGTTYVGEVLKRAGNVDVIHEPFNKSLGLVGVDKWYPVLFNDNSNNRYSDLVKGALQFKGKWSKPQINKGPIASKIYSVTGGRIQLPWRLLKVKKKLGLMPEHVIWKDPFCTFMVPYLLERKIPAVCMVKHPCAFVYSVNKQGWHFDIDDIYNEHELVEQFASDLPDELWKKAKSDNVVSLAILWKVMSRLMCSMRESKSLLVMKHEDLCANPTDSFQAIAKLFGIKLNVNALNYINQTSSSGVTDLAAGNFKTFNRNSKEIVNVWKEKMSKADTEKTLQIVGVDKDWLGYE